MITTPIPRRQGPEFEDNIFPAFLLIHVINGTENETNPEQLNTYCRHTLKRFYCKNLAVESLVRTNFLGSKESPIVFEQFEHGKSGELSSIPFGTEIIVLDCWR
uniref:Uncharacterized protein n=1 Tax=Cacopsylla melanoneura TaxID=428564 RepID=A0A8D8R883_9HEMI